jgi:hypothetical protein
MRRSVVLSAVVLLSSCRCETANVDAGAGGGPVVEIDAGAGGGTPEATGRCDIDLTPFQSAGVGASTVVQLTTDTPPIPGPNAQARRGDFLLQNDVIRVVIQGGGRVFGPQPFGGTILDADLVQDPAGDQFGEIGLLYNFGRTVKAEQYDILSIGGPGRTAILAASGNDDANDYLSIRNKLTESLGRAPLADPYFALPLRITNYFILNPGESRVRYVTAFCNTDARKEVALAVGDLVDPGYVLELFNPTACTNGFGFGGTCFGLDRMSWFAYQGRHIAYGYAPYRAGSPLIPEGQNATLTTAGITGSILGANGIAGLAAWISDSVDPRPGEIRMKPLQKSVMARDFWVARDVGRISSLIETSRASVTMARLGEFSATVLSGTTPVADARVTLEVDNTRLSFVTDSNGKVSGTVPPKTYQISAWAQGHRPTAKQMLAVSGSAPANATLTLEVPHFLTVTSKEPDGRAIPAKVTVLCTNGACATPYKMLTLYRETHSEKPPASVAAIEFIPASGTLTIPLPADKYEVLVTRGPEYSIFPNTFPTSPGAAVDMRTQDATVNAVLARVVDTTNFMSADFHVHAVNSPDVVVTNETRALSFAGDGLDILVSTDHDVVTDFAPAITALNLQPFLASIMGEETSPMEWGHYNLFPMTKNDSINGGNLDWAGGDGPTLSVAEIFRAARNIGVKTVHFNHPRGGLGGFNTLKVDLDTLATHADPALFRMAPQPLASASNSRLLSPDFNAIELLNPDGDDFDGAGDRAHANFNDWFTLLSRGVTPAGTGVSDTHMQQLATGWRTYLNLGIDQPEQVTGALVSERLNGLKASVTNSIFVNAKAFRLDATGAQVTPAVSMGETVLNGAGDVGLEVEVQGPEYLDVTKVEVFMHKAQDDATCPVDSLSPKALTTRVACNGVPNLNWPASGVTASQNVVLLPGDKETVLTANGVTYKRWRKKVSFRIPKPAKDNWMVVFVTGSKSLSPFLYAYSHAPTRPFAFTNPIFIDADGSGYDKPPFEPSGAVAGGDVEKMAPLRRQEPLSQEEILKRWGNLFGGQD